MTIGPFEARNKLAALSVLMPGPLLFVLSALLLPGPLPFGISPTVDNKLFAILCVRTVAWLTNFSF